MKIYIHLMDLTGNIITVQDSQLDPCAIYKTEVHDSTVQV